MNALTGEWVGEMTRILLECRATGEDPLTNRQLWGAVGRIIAHDDDAMTTLEVMLEVLTAMCGAPAPDDARLFLGVSIVGSHLRVVR